MLKTIDFSVKKIFEKPENILLNVTYKLPL